MKHSKLLGKWKIGTIALAAVGLSLLPGNFNVPGIGTVEAFALEKTDLTNATVTLTDASRVYTGNAITLTMDDISAIKDKSDRYHKEWRKERHNRDGQVRNDKILDLIFHVGTQQASEDAAAYLYTVFTFPVLHFLHSCGTIR